MPHDLAKDFHFEIDSNGNSRRPKPSTDEQVKVSGNQGHLTKDIAERCPQHLWPQGRSVNHIWVNVDWIAHCSYICAVYDSDGVYLGGYEHITMKSLMRYLRQWRIILLLFVMLGALWLSKSQMKLKFDLENFNGNVSSVQICRVFNLYMDAPEVTKFFVTVERLACHKNEKNWAYVDNGMFYMSDEAVSIHGPIKCNHRHLWCLSDGQLGGEMITDVKNGTQLEKTDYFRAECTENGGIEWKNLFASVVPVKSSIERAKMTVEWPRLSSINVYFIGFHSLYSLTFQPMSKAFHFLTEHLEAVVLQGYNIIGDGTPQAFIPILTTQTEEELPFTWKHCANSTDVYPMIWRNFSERDYLALYGENGAETGTTTNRLTGFKQQPTGHYFRTFSQCTKEHLVWFHYGQQSIVQCPAEALLLHGALSPHHLNTVELADDDFEERLQLMKTKGHFNNTLLIDVADHGHRFAKLRETHLGQVEERLPFFSITLPKAFCDGHGKQAWEKLKENVERLTTPFDIFSTLADLLNWPFDEQLSVPGQVSQRSPGLCRPVPKERTCANPDSAAHWCTCFQWWQSADGYEMEVKAVALTLVQAINNVTAPELQLCSVLQLNKIEDVKRLVANSDLLWYKSIKDMDGFVPDLAGNTALAFGLYQLCGFWREGH